MQSLKAASVSTETKQKTWHVFVGRLNPLTTEDEVCAHLDGVGISVVECSLLEKREKWQEKFAAFRLVVGYDDKHKIF